VDRKLQTWRGVNLLSGMPTGCPSHLDHPVLPSLSPLFFLFFPALPQPLTSHSHPRRVHQLCYDFSVRLHATTRCDHIFYGRFIPTNYGDSAPPTAVQPAWALLFMGDARIKASNQHPVQGTTNCLSMSKCMDVLLPQRRVIPGLEYHQSGINERGYSGLEGPPRSGPSRCLRASYHSRTV